MNLTSCIAVLFAAALILTSATTASAEPQTTPYFASERGAINGFDPVAYFALGRAEAGDADISLDWQGVRWHFVSIENRSLFMAEPERYTPMYGGYCALGAAHGGLVPSDATVFSIIDGKLYLNQSPEVNETWLYQPQKMIARADQNWTTRDAPPPAQTTPVPQELLDRGFALLGLDPVSYFDQDGVVAGSNDHTADWSGQRWRFATPDNRAKFLQDPQRYLPQFGGNSTLTIAHGMAIPANPLSYVIYDGKLYFDFSPGVLETLSYAPQLIIERANRNWPRLIPQ